MIIDEYRIGLSFRSFSVESTSEAISRPATGQYEKLKPLKDSPILHISIRRKKVDE
jgi:hypothetical protein